MQQKLLKDQSEKINWEQVTVIQRFRVSGGKMKYLGLISVKEIELKTR
jgi:hypothetical protein